MKFRKLNNSFRKRNGGDLIILLISLIFAFAVWGVLKLSSNYTAFYHFRVKITTQIPGREFTSLSENPLIVKGRSSGFYIIGHKYRTNANSNVIELNIEVSEIFPYINDADRYYALSYDYRTRLKEILSSKVAVDEIITDTLFFTFAPTNSKKVPVNLKASIGYAPQYMPLEDIVLNPDSVEIHGNTSTLDGINALYTEQVIRRDIDKNMQGTAPIKKIDGVTFSHNEVYYSQRVCRYFESSLQLPVQLKNTPIDKKVIIVPSTVTLKFRQDYSIKRRYVASDFVLYADYDNFATSSAKVPVLIESLPSGIVDYQIIPAFIDKIVLDQ